MNRANAASPAEVSSDQQFKRLFWSWVAMTLLLLSVALIVLVDASSSRQMPSDTARGTHRSVARALDSARAGAAPSAGAVVTAAEPLAAPSDPRD